MKELGTKDIFAGARIISALGIREEIKNLTIAYNEKKGNPKELGFDIIWVVIERATTKNAEKMIYDFVGDLLEIDSKDVANMNPTKLLDKLIEVVNVEEWKSFFTSVLRLIQRN